MSNVPSMGEFLKNSPSNWGKWGADDQIGSLNYLDAGQVLRGVQHVKQGKVHTLQVRMCDPAGVEAYVQGCRRVLAEVGVLEEAGAPPPAASASCRSTSARP